MPCHRRTEVRLQGRKSFRRGGLEQELKNDTAGAAAAPAPVISRPHLISLRVTPDPFSMARTKRIIGISSLTYHERRRMRAGHRGGNMKQQAPVILAPQHEALPLVSPLFFQPLLLLQRNYRPNIVARPERPRVGALLFDLVHRQYAVVTAIFMNGLFDAMPLSEVPWGTMTPQLLCGSGAYAVTCPTDWIERFDQFIQHRPLYRRGDKLASPSLRLRWHNNQITLPIGDNFLSSFGLVAFEGGDDVDGKNLRSLSEVELDAAHELASL